MRISSDQSSDFNGHSLRLPCQHSTSSASNHLFTLLRSFSSRYADINNSCIVYVIAISQQTVELSCSWRKASGEDSYSKLSVPRDVLVLNCRNRVVLLMEGKAAQGRRVVACMREISIGYSSIANRLWIRKDCNGNAVGCMTTSTVYETAAPGEKQVWLGVVCL